VGYAISFVFLPAEKIGIKDILSYGLKFKA